MGLSHPIIDNNLYGLNEILCKYAGIPTANHKIFFEHGMIFGSLVQNQAKNSFVQQVLTYSDYRENYLSGLNKKILKIGHYIHYADDLIEESRLRDIKEKLGHVMLIFPSHSIKALMVKYDFTELLEQIKLLRKEFDTVIVCLYWKDVQLGRAKIYEDAGCKVVTAGHFYDKYFLPRLKSIINLSDATMSNNIGTHTGYCIYLNKPHYIYSQPIKVEPIIKSKMNDELSQRSSLDWDEYNKAKDRLVDTFRQFSHTITEQQYDLTSHVWGFDYIRNQQELKDILI
jgi:hypothetical protein